MFCFQASVLLTVAIAAFGAALSAQDSRSEASAILDRFEKNLGDAAVRAAWKSLRIDGKLGAGGAGGAPFQELYLGDRVKISMKFPGFGEMTQGSTGAYCWSTDAALGIMIREGKEMAVVARHYALDRLAPWREMYATAELVGKKKVGDRDAYEIKLTGKEGASDVFFIDAETDRLLRVDVLFPDFSGGSLAMSYLYEDWQPAGKIVYPRKKIQVISGQKILWTITNVEWDAEIEDQDIAPPADVAAAAKDPKLRAAAPSKDEFATETLEARPIASIRVKAKADSISKTLAECFPEIGKQIMKSGGSMAGPPLTRYHAVTADEVDIEVAIPVKTAIKPEGRVLASELPAGKVATTWHIGIYQDLPKTHKRLEEWIAAQKLKSSGGFWEIYWTDPGLEKDPTKWRTQILWPVN
jgi:effector-binding domain-containing protein